MPNNYMLFKTMSNNQYLYDALTNTIHPWNAPLNEAFTEELYNTSDDGLDNLKFQEGLSESMKRYIHIWRAKTNAFRNTDNIHKKLYFDSYKSLPENKKGLYINADLVLVVSEQCNLRCKYCTYSDTYESYREHTNNLMTFTVAKKAIDTFYKYNNEKEYEGYADRNLNVLFYGGEPLCNFDLIKEAVNYAKKNKKDYYGLILSIVTNLTLLTKEMLKFLRDEDIFLCVSLDGPEEEHDRYRVFEDGSKTAEIIFDKLHMIRAFDKEYYNTNVRFQPTINGNSDIKKVYDFFSENEEYSKLQLISVLKDLDCGEFHKIYPYDKEKFQESIHALHEVYMEKKIKGTTYDRLDFLYHFIDKELNDIFHRMHGINESMEWYTGTCIPKRKLAISPNGNIMLCERINEQFQLGNIMDCYNEELALDLLNKYFDSLPECSKCWARKFCKVCIATVCSDFKFESHCNREKRKAKSNLAVIYSILEKNPKAFISTDPLIYKGTNNREGE